MFQEPLFDVRLRRSSSVQAEPTMAIRTLRTTLRRSLAQISQLERDKGSDVGMQLTVSCREGLGEPDLAVEPNIDCPAVRLRVCFRRGFQRDEDQGEERWRKSTEHEA